MGLTRMSVDTQPDQYTPETSGNFNQRLVMTFRGGVRPVPSNMLKLPMYGFMIPIKTAGRCKRSTMR